MKILILSTYPVRHMEIDPDKCTDRFQLITYSVSKYLKQKNIELVYESIYYPITSLKLPKQVDHTILIVDHGFYNRSSKFNQILESITSGLICNISSDNKYYNTKHTLFYINPLYFPHEKIMHPLKWPCDDELYKPTKDKIISVLSNDANINRQIEEYMKDIPHNIYTLMKYNKYNEINKMHICILNKQITNYNLLYELGMANVVIIAKDKIVDSRIVDELNIIVYKNFNKVVWEIAITEINNINIRNKLINRNYTWKSGIETILNVLFKYTSNSKELVDVVETNIIKPNTRKPVIIQSKLNTNAIVIMNNG